MSLSGPLDQASELRWLRWQGRGTRRDARGAMWRRTVLTVAFVAVGAWLFTAVRARAAEAPAGITVTPADPAQAR